MTLYYISDDMIRSRKMNYNYLHTMYSVPESVVDRIHNENELIETIRNKFYVKYAKKFIVFTNISLQKWSELLPISLSTLQRILEKSKSKLDISLSEVIVEIGEIYDIGLLAFDDNKERLNEWLDTKNKYFNFKKPFEIMDTHKGRDLVKRELIRIEYSEFS
jgi:uncharacterized protein (DUF2384 family)